MESLLRHCDCERRGRASVAIATVQQPVCRLCEHPQRCGEDSWHPYWAVPPRINFLSDFGPGLCSAPVNSFEVGVSNVTLPVTHRSIGRPELGVWMYYAAGCSDLGWRMGRTLLARNKQALLLLLSRQSLHLEQWRRRQRRRSAGTRVPHTKL